MAEHSHIEWTDATWNPVTGCSVVSPGCTNCYAMKLAGGRLRHHPSRAGLTRESKAGPVWTGKVRLNAEWLTQPLRWTKPRRIFVCAHGDLFHESVPDEWIDRVFAVMGASPQHIFQVLTKRSGRMRKYISRRKAGAPVMASIGLGLLDQVPFNADFIAPRNIWLGVSVEDQARADERIPDLLATPAAVRFLSCEPLLGAVDLEPWLAWPDGGCELPNGRYFGCAGCDAEGPSCECPRDRAWYDVTEGPRDARGCPEWVHAERITLDWVIAGGESGPDARPMHPDWARSLRDQCAAAGVPFFFKQWGAWCPSQGTDCDVGRWSVEEQRFFEGRWQMNACDAQISMYDTMNRVGKARAGRLLDGREHSEFPQQEQKHG